MSRSMNYERLRQQSWTERGAREEALQGRAVRAGKARHRADKALGRNWNLVVAEFRLALQDYEGSSRFLLSLKGHAMADAEWIPSPKQYTKAAPLLGISPDEFWTADERMVQRAVDFLDAYEGEDVHLVDWRTKRQAEPDWRPMPRTAKSILRIAGEVT